MKNQDNKPNFYKKTMHNYSAFYNRNLKKIFRVRPDIFMHILVSIVIFFATYCFFQFTESGQELSESWNLVNAGAATLAVWIMGVLKEAWDYFSKTGQAQGSDLAAGVLTGIFLCGIVFIVEGWAHGDWIVSAFIIAFLLGIPFIWGPKNRKGSYFMRWIKK